MDSLLGYLSWWGIGGGLWLLVQALRSAFHYYARNLLHQWRRRWYGRLQLFFFYEYKLVVLPLIALLSLHMFAYYYELPQGVFVGFFWLGVLASVLISLIEQGINRHYTLYRHTNTWQLLHMLLANRPFSVFRLICLGLTFSVGLFWSSAAVLRSVDVGAKLSTYILGAVLVVLSERVYSYATRWEAVSDRFKATVMSAERFDAIVVSFVAMVLLVASQFEIPFTNASVVKLKVLLGASLMMSGVLLIATLMKALGQIQLRYVGLYSYHVAHAGALLLMSVWLWGVSEYTFPESWVLHMQSYTRLQLQQMLQLALLVGAVVGLLARFSYRWQGYDISLHGIARWLYPGHRLWAIIRIGAAVLLLALLVGFVWWIHEQLGLFGVSLAVGVLLANVSNRLSTEEQPCRKHPFRKLIEYRVNTYKKTVAIGVGD